MRWQLRMERAQGGGVQTRHGRPSGDQDLEPPQPLPNPGLFLHAGLGGLIPKGRQASDQFLKAALVEGVEVAEGTHYNPYFIAGQSLAMAQPISDGQVTYDDGSPETLEQYSLDVSAFLMWAAEPHLEDRKRMGFMVMVFLAIFTALIYLTKKSVYANKEH